MTKKDYEKFAYMLAGAGVQLRDNPDMSALEMFEFLMNAIEATFKMENTRFDREKFRRFIVNTIRHAN